MKIDKITFKNNQAWVVLKDNDGNYLGTWHVVNIDFVNYIREINPEEMFFDKSLMNKKIENIVEGIYGKNTPLEDAPKHI